jgi:hypothetical protein
LENSHVCAICLFETKRVDTIETRQRPLIGNSKNSA